MHIHEHAGHGLQEGLALFLGEELLHAAADTAKMLPFLLLAYLAIELIERKKSSAIEKALAKGGRWGFVPGSLLGLVPQCGFSAMAANFYASRVITLGTLLAVFIATSDEAVPLLLAHPEQYGHLGILVLCKLGYALLVGFMVDIVLKKALPHPLRGGYEGNVNEVDCHDHHDEHEPLLLAVVRHTVSIFLVVLAFTFLFGVLVGVLGNDTIAHAMEHLGPAQPLAAALFGMVPNCASSVLLTQLYVNGAITFGSLLGGLCTNAGAGILVLLRANKAPRQNLFILGLLYVLGAALGLVVHMAAG